ncbi:hypothetical protein [Phaeovulum vinaykumarii]|nr:hypothetical protein [Phaeovulum vinaykumarii]
MSASSVAGLSVLTLVAVVRLRLGMVAVLGGAALLGVAQRLAGRA